MKTAFFTARRRHLSGRSRFPHDSLLSHSSLRLSSRRLLRPSTLSSSSLAHCAPATSPERGVVDSNTDTDTDTATAIAANKAATRRASTQACTDTESTAMARTAALIQLLPRKFLRDSSSTNYDPSTHQRTDVELDATDGRPIATNRGRRCRRSPSPSSPSFPSFSSFPPSSSSVFQSPSDAADAPRRYGIDRIDFRDDGGGWTVSWSDGATTAHSRRWVEEQLRSWESCGVPGPIRDCDYDYDYDNGIFDDDDDDDDDDNRDMAYAKPRSKTTRVPWSGLSECDVRDPSSGMTLRFDDVVFSPDETDDDNNGGMDEAIRALYRYGLLLVTGTPVNDGGEGIAALASAVSGGSDKSDPDASLLARYRRKHRGGGGGGGGDNKDDRYRTKDGAATIVLPNGTDGPLRTMYGSVWSTSSSAQSSGMSTADSAYSNGALPLHTDFTYARDPPGLQIFAMRQPALSRPGGGGHSIFVDGLAAAETLRVRDVHSFDVLCRTVRRYRSIDDAMGWHLEGEGPVLAARDRGSNLGPKERWGPIRMIRHNDLDRMPDLPPPAAAFYNDDAECERIDEFYSELDRAHAAWDDILGSDEFRLVMNLKPGDTVVVANQRCLHGRKSFFTEAKSPRVVMGCYVSQDELDSRFRRAGYHVF